VRNSSERKGNGNTTSFSPRQLAVFTVLVGALVAAGYFGVDLPVARTGRDLDVNIVNVFQYITVLGEAGWYLVGTALLGLLFHFFWKREEWARRCLFIFTAIAASGLITDLIKWLMGRWRPKAYFDQQIYGFGLFGSGYEQTSFPSGHATTVWALSLSLAVIFPRYRFLWYGLAIIVSISRMVVGAHYLSDILAGLYVAAMTVNFLRDRPLFRRYLGGGVVSRERLP
jgi:membrane-associated phospholipid phosphatase